MHLCRCCCVTVSVHVWCGANAFGEFSKSILPGARGRCSGGVRVSPGRRSSGYGLLCRPLLPFSWRRGRVQALQNSAKAGGLPPPVEVTRFFFAFAAACRRSRRAAPPGLHGKRLCFRCIVATRRFPGGMRRPHILRSVEELRVICRVFRAGVPGMLRYVAGPASSLFVGSVWFAMVRFGGDTPAVSHCRAMSRAFRTRVGVVWFGRTAVPSRCVSWLLSLLHCPTVTPRRSWRSPRGCRSVYFLQNSAKG